VPVINPHNLDQAPAACKIAGYGIARFKKGANPGLETHFHDGDELWFVIEGRIRVESGGGEYIVRQGEALFTEAGKEHNLVEILEDSVILWVEQDLRGRSRPGHLHKGEDPWP